MCSQPTSTTCRSKTRGAWMRALLEHASGKSRTRTALHRLSVQAHADSPPENARGPAPARYDELPVYLVSCTMLHLRDRPRPDRRGEDHRSGNGAMPTDPARWSVRFICLPVAPDPRLTAGAREGNDGLFRNATTAAGLRSVNMDKECAKGPEAVTRQPAAARQRCGRFARNCSAADHAIAQQWQAAWPTFGHAIACIDCQELDRTSRR